VEDVRAEWKQKGITVSAEGWQKALDIERLLDLIRSGQLDQARARLKENLGEAEH